MSYIVSVQITIPNGSPTFQITLVDNNGWLNCGEWLPMVLLDDFRNALPNYYGLDPNKAIFMIGTLYGRKVSAEDEEVMKGAKTAGNS